MPKVSVIMPVYNTPESYLRCAIESVLSQTYTDYEFLIIDDGSTNLAPKIVKYYADKRIRLIENKKNKGLIYSLNRALDEAKGEFIARMDSDDLSLPTRFEKQVAYLEKTPDVSLVGTSTLYFDGSNRVFFAPANVDKIKFSMLSENPIAHPTVMFRAKDFKNLRYDEDFKHAEDYDLWARALIKGLKLANLPEVLLSYRIHKEQVGHKHNKIQEQNAIRVRKNYIKAFDPTLSEREVDTLINLTNEHIKLKGLSPAECESLLKKVVKRNVKTRFFDSRTLINWVGDVSQELKYPKVRLFSLKLGKKHTLYLAHKKSTFRDEKAIFNCGIALTEKD